MLALLVAVPAGASVVLGPVSFDGSNYWVLSSQGWATAEAEAQSLGGHLVTIGSAGEQDFLLGLAGGTVTGHWIGFNDLATEGDWRWASGEASGYAHWNTPTEPNDGWGAGEDCAVLEVAWGGLWNDLPCERVQPAIVEAPIGPCDLFLYLPIYDGGTYQGGCNVQMNGVVLSKPGCPHVVRIHWDWGDGSDNDSWFAGSHSYEQNGSYQVTVTPFDAAGGSTSATVPLEVTTCDPLGPVDPELYRTDFQDLWFGSIDGQDGWLVGTVSCPGCSTSVPGSLDGEVVHTDSGQMALQVPARPAWGYEVGRFFGPASRRFVAVTFDFATRDGGSPFWFVDSKEPGAARVHSSYFFQDWVRSNATPGLDWTWHSRDAWHRTGFEVDGASGRILAFFYDGSWYADDDSALAPLASQLGLFYFRGVGADERLWIDNLRISESDSPRSSRGATAALDDTLADLPPAVFENANQQHALAEKLDEVVALIEAGSYAEARDKLEHDVLKKTDGCATVGHPDKNDWIEDCAAQGEIHALVLNLLALLEESE